MDQETINEVVGYLCKIKETNNLAARIDVLYRMRNNFSNFKPGQVESIRELVTKNINIVDEEIAKKAYKIADYFESVLVAETLKGRVE
ncbi:gp327 [Bacillus phage G]|uniref:Gp327 n=1 Tax=Bacillus phage G TaxID=2884420 RepID=G3MA68_9CAUD|nr:gp327 [Bacillus phage G]AEO93586.1 gp327 [Bacillus phage G]